MNTGTVNVERNPNVNVNRNVNAPGGYYGGPGYYGPGYYGPHYNGWGYPVGAGVAVAATAIAVGTMVATLPSSGCTGVSVGGVAYQHCGQTY